MILLLLILMCSVAHADVYVLVSPDKSIAGLSDQDDMVVPDGYKKEIVSNKTIKDLPITPGEEKLYTFNKGSFSLNAQKVSDKNKAEQESILQLQTKTENKASGLQKLKDAAKLTDEEAQALFQ